jgi:hypothetical protein
MTLAPQALIIPGKRYAKVHTLDCSTALGLEAKGYGPYARVPLSVVPANASRCGICGGPPSR